MDNPLDGVTVLYDAVSPAEVRKLNAQLRAEAAVLIQGADSKRRQAARQIYNNRIEYSPPIGWR